MPRLLAASISTRSSVVPSRMATHEGQGRRLAVLEVRAVERLGEDPGERRLAGAARTDEQERVRDATGPDGVAERLDDRLLARRSRRTSGRASGGRWPGAGRATSPGPSGRGRARIEMPCTLRRPDRPRAHHDGRLGPGRAAAPGDDRLVLLPSGPDTVRGSPLRGTRSSTSHRPAAFEDGDLGRGFSPAGADCRYRAPLVPRLARPAQGYPEPRLSSTGSGGEGGIRTRDGLPRTAFPVRRHSPLGDLSPRESRCSVERARGRADAGIGRAETTVCGGEGGIRTRGAFAHRFSRAAPSTTRTPLRGRGYQTPGRARPTPRPGETRQATGAADADANSAWASSRRMPLTTLMRRRQGIVLGELDDGPGGARCDRSARANTSASTSLSRRAPTHIAQGSRVAKIVASAQAVCAQLAGGLAEGADHRVGRRVVAPPGPDHGPARPSPRRRRRRPRWAARRGSAPARPRRAPRP